MYQIIRALLASMLCLFPFSAFAQANQQVSQYAGLTAGTSVEINARTLPKVVVLVGRDASGRNIPFGVGYFVDPWTIITDYQITKNIVEQKVKSIHGISLDQKKIYLIVYLSEDTERQVLFLDVREKGPEPIPLNEIAKIKEGDKVYLVNHTAKVVVANEMATTDTSSQQLGLVETVLPVSGESRGMPLLDELGRLVGMTVDPKTAGVSVKDFLTAKQLQAKLKKYLAFMKSAETNRTVVPSEPTQLIPGSPTEEREGGGISAAQPQRAGSVISSQQNGQPIRSLSAKDMTVRVKAAYPEIAREQRVGGLVTVKFKINGRGEVIEAEIRNGHSLLQLAALRAIRLCRFKPTSLINEPVKPEGTLSFVFSSY